MGIIQGMSCIFCDIIDKKSPADIYYEDSHVIVFADIFPRKPIHLLITPKRHYARLVDVPDEDVLRLMNTAKLVAEKLAIAHNFRLQLNNGAEAGQIIEHLHFHFLSNEKGIKIPYRT
jgi:histidine triad (HIT) family protein